MTDYAKFSVRGLYSKNSDYSDPNPDTRQFDIELTPGEVLYHRVTAGAAAATIDLSSFTTITAILVRNNSHATAPGACWVTVHQALSNTGALVNVVVDGAGNPDTVALAGETWVTTYGVAAGMYVRISAATNTGTHLIQTAGEASLTLGVGEAPTTATENATLYFQSKNIMAVQAEGAALITGAIVPGNDLVYQSAAGTPELEIFIVGA